MSRRTQVLRSPSGYLFSSVVLEKNETRTGPEHSTTDVNKTGHRRRRRLTSSGTTSGGGRRQWRTFMMRGVEFQSVKETGGRKGGVGSDEKEDRTIIYGELSDLDILLSSPPPHLTLSLVTRSSVLGTRDLDRDGGLKTGGTRHQKSGPVPSSVRWSHDRHGLTQWTSLTSLCQKSDVGCGYFNVESSRREPLRTTSTYGGPLTLRR